MIRNAHFTVPTPEMLAELGTGRVAYIKPIMSEDAARLYPQLGQIKPGVKLFTLNTANGTPILIADSAELAAANAGEHKLVTVPLH